MSHLVRFGVSMEEDLLGEFDRYIAEKGYRSRSEAVRDLVRQELSRAACESPGSQAVGSVTLLYHHEKPQLSEQLIKAQHRHHDVTVSTLHAHIDSVLCLEVLILRGSVREIRNLADGLLATKGVTHGQLVLMAIAPSHGQNHDLQVGHEHVHGPSMH